MVLVLFGQLFGLFFLVIHPQQINIYQQMKKNIFEHVKLDEKIQDTHTVRNKICDFILIIC